MLAFEKTTAAQAAAQIISKKFTPAPEDFSLIAIRP
jgi:hypothetical protein